MVAVTTAAHKQLVKSGLPPRGAAALRATSQDWKTILRTGALTSRQVRTLRAGTPTMAKLIRGGFTRAQAQLILANPGMIAAPTFVAASTSGVNSSAATVVACGAPAGVQVGDLLVLLAVTYGPESAITPPAGFTQFAQNATTGGSDSQNIRTLVATKTAVSGDVGASFNTTFAAANDHIVSMVAVRPAAGYAVAVDVSASSLVSSHGNPVTMSQVTPTASDLLLEVVGIWTTYTSAGVSAFTDPAGVTRATASSQAGRQPAAWIGYRSAASAGVATPADQMSATFGGANYTSHAYTLALKSA